MKTLFLCLCFWVSATAAFAQCSTYDAPANGKPVKVTVWTKEGECFKLTVNGIAINPDNANSVTFYESAAGAKKMIVTLADGNVVTKNATLSPDMASVTYKVDQNKKGEWGMSMQLGKAEMSAEAIAREDAEDKAEEEESARQAKADEEARAAQKAKAEAQWKESEDAIAKEDAEREAAKNPKPAETAGGGSGASKPAAGGSSSGGKYIPIQFLYGAGQPIANTTMTLKTAEGALIGTATTDGNGLAKFDPQLPPGAYSMDLYGSKGGSDWSLKGMYSLTINEERNDVPIVLDILEGIRSMAEMMGMDPDALAAMYGIK